MTPKMEINQNVKTTPKSRQPQNGDEPKEDLKNQETPKNKDDPKNEDDPKLKQNLNKVKMKSK